MESKKRAIRVLHIVGRMDRGGIETMIMNIYRNIDRNKVQFDFLAHYGREAEYNDEIRSLGGRIYEMPALKDENKVYYWKFFSYVLALNKFFREHSEYKIIHCHMTNTASIYLPVARKYGVSCRILHSHSSRGKLGLLGTVTNFLQKDAYKMATDWFACSKVAVDWMYPEHVKEKVKIIPNAVDASKFRYSKIIREEMRNELHLNNELAIGCIARFRKEKNQAFLIDVLQSLLTKKKNSHLIFVGDGPELKKVMEYAEQKQVIDKITFLGLRNDVEKILQALDVIVMPSLWEGLPVSGIEAQASGLSVIASDTVSDEMNIIGKVRYLSLDSPTDIWANTIIEESLKNREDTYTLIKSSGYDIKENANWLENFYLSKLY